MKAAAWQSPVLVQRRGVFVTTSETPNPDSMMFRPEDRDVVGTGNKVINFTNKYETNDSPLAAALFKVKGVKEIMLAAEHVTVTKDPNIQWMLIEANITLVMSQFFASGMEAIKRSAIVREEKALDPNVDPESVEAQILEVLEDRVRPFVQQDGGDVEFDRFEEDSGTLYLSMIGACNGCSKKGVTLNMGIKNLMQHFIPQVKEIKDINDAEDEEIASPNGPQEVAL